MKKWPGLHIKVSVMLCVFCVFIYGRDQEQEMVSDSYKTGDFQLVFQNQVADIYIDPADYKVVHIAGSDFAEDIERITGIKPKIKHTADNLAKQSVIIGTAGKSKIINQLERSGKLDLSRMKGKLNYFANREHVYKYWKDR